MRVGLKICPSSSTRIWHIDTQIVVGLNYSLKHPLGLVFVVGAEIIARRSEETSLAQAELPDLVRKIGPPEVKKEFAPRSLPQSD